MQPFSLLYYCKQQTASRLIYCCLLLIWLLINPQIISSTDAATWYVNNKTGSDNNNGISENTAVATISRAITLAGRSDTLELANTGIPYRETMLFRNLGGSPDRPFVVEGNGAVLSGLKAIDVSKWETVKEGLFVFPLDKTPYGNPFLVSRGKRIPQAKSLDLLQTGEHYWDRSGNKIYFLCDIGKRPAEYQLEATLRISGLTLTSASYIVCRNLSAEFFSNDGFNIHGDCRGVRLENVIARHNGDDGISIHESGGLIVQNAHVHDNFFGIQDVNASRSVYNGVLAERNQIGVSLVGGYHSLVDCQIKDSIQKEVDIAGANPGHLIGAEYNPLCKTILFAQNVSLFGNGNQTGLSIRNGATAIIERSVISDSQTGLMVDGNSFCHMSQTAIIDCDTILKSNSPNSFFDFNYYTPGQINRQNTLFQTGQFADYVRASKDDSNSHTGPLKVRPDGIVELPPGSEGTKAKLKVGPSDPITSTFSVVNP
ncbi:MAG: hypothetical protein CME31_22670 [Gimesia sp.]|jgi:hypothetical protein|uniref:Right handed beta helix domain-containing protein n=1 Tax=Gimesia maris TaxID=122 RepID=A0A3D3R9B4_9PLAN|nr:hypothetical protein [Gimesia sp.]HCO24607.1 hypothetical protein [Gimesia maris]|tara:strand:+ start:20905 stop:22359 length:1455 start_codon:yes stop_codon:yes gene_type:complete